MNEVASFGDVGFSRSFTLLDEHLQFGEGLRGKLQVTMMWTYDKSTDELLEALKRKPKSIFAMLKDFKRMILPKALGVLDDSDDSDDEKKDVRGCGRVIV